MIRRWKGGHPQNADDSRNGGWTLGDGDVEPEHAGGPDAELRSGRKRDRDDGRGAERGDDSGPVDELPAAGEGDAQ